MRKNWVLVTVLIVLACFTLMIAGCSGGESKPEEKKVEYPTKPITLIVPFSAGGISDTISRSVAEAAKNYIDQPINVVNRPGGSATVGTNEMVTSAPDGYTFMFGSSGELASGMHLVEAPYDIESYTPLCQIGSMRVVLAVNKASEWKNLEEFVAYAKENPGELSVGIPGKGTVVHLTGEYFCQEAGIELNVVPFQGSGPLIPGLLGGHVDAAFLNVPEIMSQFSAGEANILAVFSDERVEAVKDAPTAKEQGFDVAGGASHFIAGPNDIPEDVANIVRDLMKKVTSDEKFLDVTTKMGYSVKYAGTEESKEFLKHWYDTGGEIYKKLGMTK